MTKSDFVDAIASNKNLPEMSKRIANVVLDAVFEILGKAIKKDKKYTVPGFGTFTVRKRAARIGRNPQTGKPIKIPASKTVTFKPAAAFKVTL